MLASNLSSYPAAELQSFNFFLLTIDTTETEQANASQRTDMPSLICGHNDVTWKKTRKPTWSGILSPTSRANPSPELSTQNAAEQPESAGVEAEAYSLIRVTASFMSAAQTSLK